MKQFLPGTASMITLYDHSRASRKPTSGFTLVELMIAMAIAAFALTGAYLSFTTLAKGSESVVSYTDMNSQTRSILNYLGRDARSARTVTYSDEDFFAIETIHGDSVSYLYDENEGTVTRDSNGQVTTVLNNVSDFKFTYYTFRQQPTTRGIEVKHVQAEARLENRISNLMTSDAIVTTRFMLRNHNVSN